MKKVLMLLISLVVFQIKSSSDEKHLAMQIETTGKAKIEKGKLEQLLDEGRNIQAIIEERLAIEFEKQSDEIFNNMKFVVLESDKEKYDKAVNLFRAKTSNSLRATLERYCDINLRDLGRDFANVSYTQTNDFSGKFNNQIIKAGDEILNKMISELDKYIDIGNSSRSTAKTEKAIATSEDFSKARMQANAKVNLNNLLDVVMNNVIIAEINNLYQKISKILNFTQEQFDEFRTKHPYARWPHSDYFRKRMEKRLFEFKPTYIKSDRMICKSCNAEIYNLQEKDIASYYHKSNCLEGVLNFQNDADVDAQLTIVQRIKCSKDEIFKYADSDSIEPLISDCLTKYLSNDSSKLENVIKLVSVYSGINSKLILFLDFYDVLQRLNFFVLVEKYFAKKLIDEQLLEHKAEQEKLIEQQLADAKKAAKDTENANKIDQNNAMQDQSDESSGFCVVM